MTLSEYLIEAVANRTTGKYFDFDSLDISSTSYRDLLVALNVSGIPVMPEINTIIISSLMNINKNSDALKELVKINDEIGGNSNCMWSPSPTGRDCLYFFYIENSKRATVWRLEYRSPTSVPKDCIRVTLPSGNKNKDIVWNLKIIGDMIKLTTK